VAISAYRDTRPRRRKASPGSLYRFLLIAPDKAGQMWAEPSGIEIGQRVIALDVLREVRDGEVDYAAAG
jgi:hypothetical protein